MMPGMDGYEVCRRLRANLKTAFIPILMLTALADTKSKSLGFLAGTDDYLVKPFENAELRSRVGWLLATLVSAGVQRRGTSRSATLQPHTRARNVAIRLCQGRPLSTMPADDSGSIREIRMQRPNLPPAAKATSKTAPPSGGNSAATVPP